MQNCKNCGFEFSGNFCPQCGQKVITQRFNLKDSLKWLVHSIFNLDHGFTYTTKELILHPGKVIISVLSGVTIRYTHPFRLLFIWATISTILTLMTGTYDEQTAEIGKSMEFSERQMAFQTKVNVFMKKYLNFIIMANVPLVSIISLLFYRKRNYNFTEHMVVNSYGYSVATALGVVLVLLQYFIHYPTIMIWASMILNVLIMGYTYSDTFKENYLLSSFKYLLAFLFSYLIAIVVFVFALLAYAFFAEATGLVDNPFAKAA